MEKKTINLKLLMVLALNIEGLNYKEISKKTNYHINTISRCVSYLHSKEIVDIKQIKSNSIRGRKWVNVVKLNKEFNTKTVPEFLHILSNKLKCSLSDLFINSVILI